MSNARLIAGLGNPGREYRDTRHNVGFLIIEELARRWNAPASRHVHRSQISEVLLNGRKIFLAQPQTYMNLSGQAIAAIMRYYRLELDDLLVVYDDLDLTFGRIRVRPDGSAGGHNGVRSLIEALGSQEFARVRVGVGRPDGGNAVSYVLGRWTREEAESLGAVVCEAADATAAVIEKGLQQAMNEFNRR